MKEGPEKRTPRLKGALSAVAMSAIGALTPQDTMAKQPDSFTPTETDSPKSQSIIPSRITSWEEAVHQGNGQHLDEILNRNMTACDKAVAEFRSFEKDLHEKVIDAPTTSAKLNKHSHY